MRICGLELRARQSAYSPQEVGSQSIVPQDDSLEMHLRQVLELVGDFLRKGQPFRVEVRMQRIRDEST
jgi:hypothetical protein